MNWKNSGYSGYGRKRRLQKTLPATAILLAISLWRLLHHRLSGLVRLVESRGGFGGHIVLIMLGKNLIGAENTIICQFPLGYHPFAFLEQVRENACINHRNHLCRIGHDEIHGYTVTLPPDAAFFHQSADPEAFPHRSLIGGNLAGTEKEYQVTLERVQHKYRSKAQCSHAGSDNCQFLMTRFHLFS